MVQFNFNSPTLTMEEAFENFLFAKSAQGVTEKTIKSYKSHFHCISKHLDICSVRAVSNPYLVIQYGIFCP